MFRYGFFRRRQLEKRKRQQELKRSLLVSRPGNMTGVLSPGRPALYLIKK